MADHGSASIVTLHQPRPPKAKTPAERARAYRQRKRAAALPAVIIGGAPTSSVPRITLLPNGVVATPLAAPSRRHAAPILLTVAALALAVVGVTINAWYAGSLGASEAAGWLFLAIGVAADLVALVIPTCAAVSGRRISGARRLLGGWSGC